MGGDQGHGGPAPPGRGAPELSDDDVARLRTRAEQLRARRLPPPRPVERPPATPEPEAPADDDEVAEAVEDVHADGGAFRAEDAEDPDPFHEADVDPDARALLDRWADEARDESVEPRHNWSPLVAVLVLLAIVAAGALGAWALIDSSAEDTPDAGSAGGPGDTAAEVEDDGPSLEDLTADVTPPPGPEQPLQVAAQGFTIVPDRFESDRREGTFAVIVENPHERWLAQGVQVTVSFLDEAGTAVSEDSGFVEVVLPSQRVAVASLFFDAPTVPLSSMDVAIEVARWRETGPVEGGFEITEVETTAADLSGVRTTFRIRSGFDEPLTDVGITAVYTRADGTILGGYDTFVERLEPGQPAAAEIALLANLDATAIATTELYATAAFGSVPD